AGAEASFLSICSRLLRPKQPLDPVVMHPWTRERAVLFETLTCAALHTRVHVLRHVGEIPTPVSQGRLAERFLQLSLVSFEERCDLHGQVPAKTAQVVGLLLPDDGEIRLVVTLRRVYFLPRGGLAQQFAREHVTNVRVDARRGEAKCIGDLRDRFGLP